MSLPEQIGRRVEQRAGARWRPRLAAPAALGLAAALLLAGAWLVAGRSGAPAGAGLMVGGAALASIATARLLGRGAGRAAAGRRQGRWPALVGLGLAAALLPLFTSGLESLADVHGDELFWMPTGSYAFRLFFIERDYADPFWSDFRYYFLAYHPQVGKLLIGGSLAAAGFPVIPFQPFDWGQSVAWNLEHGFRLEPAALAAARLPAALAGVGAGLAIYWLGLRAASWRHGLLASVCFASGPIVLGLGRRAMLDMPALCFSLLAAACAIEALRALRAGRGGVAWACAAGVACGLATGAKLSAALVASAAGLPLLYEAVRRRRLAPLACLGVMAGWTALVFYITNPLLYDRPLGGTLQMLSFVQIVQDTPFSPTRTPGERAAAVWESLHMLGLLGRLGLPGDRLLALAGAAALAASLIRAPAAAQERGGDGLALWMAAALALTLLTLPAAIDRYLLPTQPIVALLQAYGTISLVQRLGRLYRLRRR